MDLDDLMKICPSCGAFIPIKAKICEYCNFEFKEKVLTDIELQTPISDIIEKINGAFFRLESFMAGTILNYKSFNFIGNFELFFAKAKLSENFSPDIKNLIDDYWQLTEQLRVDTDKGNYNNKEAYENEAYNNDINAIMHLNNSHKFAEFTTEEDIAKYEKRFSVLDIINKAQLKPETNKAENPIDIFNQLINLFVVFENLKFNLEEGADVTINLESHSFQLYSETNLFKLNFRRYYLLADNDKFYQFCIKLITELNRINQKLEIPYDFGINLDFKSLNYTIEPENLKAYVNINKMYISEIIDFVKEYINPNLVLNEIPILEKSKSPLPIIKLQTLSNKKKIAKEYLLFLNFYNIHQKKIMSQSNFELLMRYTNYLIEHESLNDNIQPIPQIEISNEFLRYTFYLIHKELFGTKRIKQIFIDFLHAVFSQFKNIEKSTTKTKFSVSPKSYDKDILIIKSNIGNL